MKYETLKEMMFLKGNQRKIIDTLNDHPNIDFVDFLDEHNNTALHHAVSLKYEQAILIYLRLLRNPKLWSKKINSPITDEYIQYRVKLWINAENQDGLTAIHYASLKGLVKIAEILQDAGARVDKVTTNGSNVLNLAAQQNRIASMIFFRGKADINATDHKKCTALHWACFKGHLSIVKYLVSEKQTKLDFQEETGRTALHVAVIYGHESIVKALLLAGANRFIKDKRHKTAKDYAEETENESILKLMVHQEGFLCSKNYTYRLRRKPNISELLMVMLLLYAIITENYILNDQSILKASQDQLSGTNSQFIYSPYLLIAEVVFTTLSLGLGIYMHYSKSPLVPNDLQVIKERLVTDVSNFCFCCRTETEEGIQHCDLCKQCTILRVKHSHLIGRCIGANIIRWYIVFLACLWIVMSISIVKGVSLLNYLVSEDGIRMEIPMCIMIVVDLTCLIPFLLLLYHIYKCCKIVWRSSQFTMLKYLSQTTLNTRTTLLAHKIEQSKQKHGLYE